MQSIGPLPTMPGLVFLPSSPSGCGNGPSMPSPDRGRRLGAQAQMANAGGFRKAELAWGMGFSLSFKNLCRVMFVIVQAQWPEDMVLIPVGASWG